MFKDTGIWLPDYIKGRMLRKRPGRPTHILFAFADHFEPEQRPGDPPGLQRDRVKRWIEDYERAFSSCSDSNGRHPKHTYFFPQEQYIPEILDMLAGHCSRGFGEVEIHIHHDNDTADGFVEKIEHFKRQLRSHGLLPRDAEGGGVSYGFVHGNWALDNSRKDGRWCGLDNEITLLKETGCYADFTLPCSPADGQTKKTNSIYFAYDDPLRPKSHDTGRDLAFGKKLTGDLLMIQGPLGLNWRRRSRLVFPGIENGDVSLTNPITKDRVSLWAGSGVSVRGREDVVFVKVHTHGMKPKNTDMLLGKETLDGFRILEDEYNDGKNYILHYVSAREMANVAYALNDGSAGDIPSMFDYRFRLP